VADAWTDLRRLDLVVRPLDAWPGTPTPPDRRETSRFDSTLRSTLEVLARELDQLDAERIVLQLDLRPGQIRVDGLPRADARAGSPGVVLGFGSAHGPLRYACDRFVKSPWRRESGDDWQHNLRAIALGLEALRKVDRYGISKRGEQYRGYAELPAGIAAPATHMTTDEAAKFIAKWGGGGWADVLARPDQFERSYRRAAKELHPDRGGDAALFQRLQAAKQLLDREADHG
jgi:hypothetical protein